MGKDGVCGESDKGWECASNKNYQQAADQCEQVGGRLCTEMELLWDAAHSTGCSFNGKFVWSSTSCTTNGNENGRFVYKSKNLTTQCRAESISDNISVRCCA